MNLRVISAILLMGFFLSETIPGFAETLPISEQNSLAPASIPLEQSQSASAAAQQNVDTMNFLQTLSGPVTQAAPTPSVQDISIFDPDGNFSVKVEGSALTVTFPTGFPFGYYRYRMNLDNLSSFSVETKSLVSSLIGTRTQVDAASNAEEWRSSLARLSENLRVIQQSQTDSQTVQSLQTLIDRIDQAAPSESEPPSPVPPPSGPDAQLQAALQADPAAKEAFTSLFAYRILQIGETSTIAEVAYRNGFNLQSFLNVVVKARQLDSAMFEGTNAYNFLVVFNKVVPPSSYPPADTVQAFFDIAGDPNFNQTAFLSVLPKVASLYEALQADDAARNAMNQKFGTQVQSAGYLTDVGTRTTLFNLTGDPNFNQSGFIDDLKGLSDPSHPGAVLFTRLQSVSGAVAAFDALYGANLSSGAASQADLDVLNNVATGWCYPQNCGFDADAYIPVLLKALTFYQGIVAGGLGEDFNRMQNHLSGSYDPYGAPQFMNGNAPSGQSLKTIFDLSGDPSFDVGAYLAVLPKAASLVKALAADPAALAAFNQKFGTTLKEVFFYKGYWPSIYAPQDGYTLGTLFNLTGDPNFNQSAFIAQLKGSAPPPGSTGQALLQALQATSGAEQAFDTLFFPAIFAKGREAALNDVASQPGFDAPAFVSVLLKAQQFYSAVTSSQQQMADFAVLFNEPIPSAVSNQTHIGLNGNAVQIVFGLTGDPDFSLGAFTDALAKAGSLYRALQSDAEARITFNQRYGAQVPASGNLLDGGVTRTALFNLVKDPVYNQDALIASLKSAVIVTPNNPATNWLKSNQQASPYGLLESYPGDPAMTHQGFTYDEAVAGMLLLKQGDLGGAKLILNFFKSRWDGSGYLTVYNTQNPGGSVIEVDRVLGPTAWVGLFAVQDYKRTNDPSSLELADKIARWALTLPRADGGVAMGASGTFWADKFSVENNLDAYALFKALSEQSASAANRALFAAEASNVKSWLLTEGYNAQTGLFRRGGYLGGNVNALDVNSWAVLVLGPETLQNDFNIDPDALLAKTESVLAVQEDGSFGGNILEAKGFDFSGAENANEIGRAGVKWVEGTNHMILAYKMMANYYAERGDTDKALYYAQRADYFSLRNFRSMAPTSSGEGYTYTDTPGTKVFADNPYWHASSGPSVAATAWVYFAQTDFNPFSD